MPVFKFLLHFSLKKYLCFSLFIFFLLFLLCGFYSALQITNYTYSNSDIPKEFDGYKIVQISDFHCQKFGEHEKKLIQAIKELDPDLIVLTGDMIDDSHSDITPVYDLLEGISGIAPIYQVSGNHDSDSLAPTAELNQLYQYFGVIDLNDAQVKISSGSAYFTIYGLANSNKTILTGTSKLPTVDTSTFSLCLYHYGNFFDYFANTDFDLLLAGHVHGGIIRLPFLGGILGNDRTFFPKYTSGVYTNGSITMILSRGLGNNLIPRFYNRPELVCVTLHTP